MQRKNSFAKQQSLSILQSADRDINLDFIRVVAIFFVISVHFFWNSGFYQEIIIGYKCFFMVSLRTLSVTCVPLFLLLTGYLMSVKKVDFSFHYYRRIIRIIGIYILSKIIILIFTKYHLHQNINFLYIAGFRQYSWYVNMYIGLLIMIPFLNIVWENLKSEEHKKYLLFSCLFLTVFPSIVNMIVFDWWSSIYPVTYYFLGAYLAYKEAIIKNREKLFILLAINLLLFSSLNYFRSYNENFIYDEWNAYGSFQNATNAVLVFSLLKSIPLNFKVHFRKMICKIADLSYGMYLTSWIMDQIVYEKLLALVPLQDRAYYYLPCVILVFIGSFCLSYIVDRLYNIMAETITLLHQ